nr:ankyrin repeat domain-containing protein [Caldimonas mangrovi]
MAADRALRAPAPRSVQAPASLSQAAARGDVQRVQELLATGASADTRDAQGRTPLLEAVLLGDGSRRYVDAARLLLEARADPNAADRDGVTPLAHARRLGYDELARLIESHGGH